MNFITKVSCLLHVRPIRLNVNFITKVSCLLLVRPVRLNVNFNTNMTMAGNRSPFLAKYKVGHIREGGEGRGGEGWL